MPSVLRFAPGGTKPPWRERSGSPRQRTAGLFLAASCRDANPCSVRGLHLPRSLPLKFTSDAGGGSVRQLLLVGLLARGCYGPPS